MALSMMKLDLRLLILLLTIIGQCQAFDCATFSFEGSTTCVANSVTYYCGNGLVCCENGGCCYSGAVSAMYSPGEALGLGLCISAFIATGLLTLIICGATYCSSKEDTSVLFMAKK